MLLKQSSRHYYVFLWRTSIILRHKCLNLLDTYGVFIKQEELSWQFLNVKCAVEISR